MNTTTKKQQNGDEIAASLLGEGFLTVNKRLIESLLREKTPPVYIVGYITLLALARHQEEATDQGVCRAEVFVTVPELSRMLNMDEKCMRTFIYWLEDVKHWMSKRLINGRRAILLTQYDQHTCNKRRVRKVVAETVTPVNSSKFSNEDIWK